MKLSNKSKEEQQIENIAIVATVAIVMGALVALLPTLTV
jgi:hypothetical protein